MSHHHTLTLNNYPEESVWLRATKKKKKEVNLQKELTKSVFFPTCMTDLAGTAGGDEGQKGFFCSCHYHCSVTVSPPASKDPYEHRTVLPTINFTYLMLFSMKVLTIFCMIEHLRRKYSVGAWA